MIRCQSSAMRDYAFVPSLKFELLLRRVPIVWDTIESGFRKYALSAIPCIDPSCYFAAVLQWLVGIFGSHP